MLFIDYREYKKDRVEIKFNYVIYGTLKFIVENIIISLSNPLMLITYPEDEIVAIVTYDNYPLISLFEKQFPNKQFIEISDSILRSNFPEYLAGVQDMTRVSYFLSKRLEMNEIIPNLFLSGENYADDKPTHDVFNIRSIINVTEEITNPFEEDPEYTYLTFKLRDIPGENIYKCFDVAVEFITTQLANGKPVLVHCAAGVSRSATIIMAYIMKIKKLSANKAYQFVKNKRCVVEPNMGFYKQLLDYEKDIIRVIENPTSFSR